MNKALIIPLALYIVANLALGLYVSRKHRSQSLEDFYLAGRSLGGFVLALTLVTTFASASSFIGGPGIASRLGLSWVYLALIQVPTAWVTLGVLGKRFAIVARRTQCLTITSFLEGRYQSKGVARCASLALMIFFLAAMTAQFVGGARLFQAVTGLNYQLCLFLFTGTVALYTCFGGARAVALTDTLQGFVMMTGTALLLFAVARGSGGFGAAFAALEAKDPALVSVHGPGGAVSWPQLVSFWALVCFAVVGLPHTAGRCLSYNTSRAMHRAMVVSTPVMTFILLGMTLCGAFAPLFLSGVESDLMMPTLAIKLLPGWAAGVFLAGPIAGMMSTLDSQLLQMAATVTQDLTHLGHGDEKKAHRWARLLTLILGLVVCLLALNPPELLVWLNLFALGGLEAVFLWPLVLGLYWKKGGSCAAYCSMLCGLGSYFLFRHIPLGGAHEVLPTLVVSLLAYGVGAYLGPQPEARQLEPYFNDSFRRPE